MLVSWLAIGIPTYHCFMCLGAVRAGGNHLLRSLRIADGIVTMEPAGTILVLQAK